MAVEHGGEVAGHTAEGAAQAEDGLELAGVSGVENDLGPERQEQARRGDSGERQQMRAEFAISGILGRAAGHQAGLYHPGVGRTGCRGIEESAARSPWVCPGLKALILVRSFASA